MSRRLKLTLSVFNLLDSRQNAAAFDYVSRLAGELAAGVDDHQFHPLEPISARFSVTATF